MYETLKNFLIPLGERSDPGEDYASVLAAIGDARIVLIGEASHGTEDFYAARAAITLRLIREKGFSAVVAEADWPDALRVNRYARLEGTDPDANRALGDFKRFPAWMWRNTVVERFVDDLRAHNAGRPPEARAGFYGMDLYSLRASIDAVLGYLEKLDPSAGREARRRYACFDHFDRDEQAYAMAGARGSADTCEDDVVRQLIELRGHAAEYSSRDGQTAREAFFFAERNAVLVKNAEEYYRSMYRGNVHSWNLRDSHMADTLERLVEFLKRDGREAKVVVWAHNSHLGDARSTGMGDAGEINVGQLMRERFDDEAYLLGFTTFTGWVTASGDWGDPCRIRRVRPALAGSHERVFHELGVSRFFLSLRDPEVRAALDAPRLERAIGVIYRPETERGSHYFHARLPGQFDGILHFDETEALKPLETTPFWIPEETPETYPTGM